MSLTRTCALLVGMCCLGGCAYSTHPVATDEVAVDELDLSGRWRVEGEGLNLRAVVFKKVGEKLRGAYGMEFVLETDVESPEWYARLLKLDDTLYLEICPTNEELDGLHAAFNLPLHKLYRISATEDELRVDACHDGELIAAARKEGLGVFKSHEERFVITATTQQLQRLYREHGGRFFSENRSIRLRRQRVRDDKK